MRATEDLDLFIRGTAENVERLRAALRASYANDPHIEEISAADLLGDYPAVRYYPPSGDLYFDILTRLGEVASFETVEAETREIEGARVSVATPLALYRLKKARYGPSVIRTPRPYASGSTSRMMRIDVPVQKFRSIEDMNRAAPLRPSVLADFDRFLRHCARYWKIAPRVR